MYAIVNDHPTLPNVRHVANLQDELGIASAFVDSVTWGGPGRPLPVKLRRRMSNYRERQHLQWLTHIHIRQFSVVRVRCTIALNIPLSGVTGMYVGAAYLGGYFFTLEYGGTRTDMSAIYGGGQFRDHLAAEIRAAGGQVY